MKKLYLALLLIALCALALAVPLPAHAKEAAPEPLYKKKGFFLGGEVGGLVAFSDDVFGAPGKLDFLVGYQINPYVSVAADLWTFWFIAYAAEAQVKVNFTDSKISPYAVGTVGAVGVINVWDDGDDGVESSLTYSAGLGADFHLWKRTTLFAEVKYRGGNEFSDFNSAGHGLEAGVGLRWTF